MAGSTVLEAGEGRLLGDDEDRQGEVEEGGGVSLEQSLEQSAASPEMLPMAAVAHLSRRDRLGIIRKTVPTERRMVVLQRLFHLAQGGCEVVRLVGRGRPGVLIADGGR